MSQTVEKLIEQGQKAYSGGNYLAAARAFEEAAAGYEAMNEPLSSAEMKNNQSVALLQAEKAGEALEAVAGTASIFAKAGDRKRQAFALGNEAAALDALGKYNEAVDRYSRSAEILEELGEKEMLATVLKSLSAVQVRANKPFDAVLSMQSALASKEKPSMKERILKKLLRFRFP